MGKYTPYVEAQYIKFAHNAHQLDEAKRMLRALGIDQFVDFWGSLQNHADHRPFSGPLVRKSFFPRCFWPFFSMVIRYDGLVVPCCMYRLADQYAAKPKIMEFGDLNKESLIDLWNNENYRTARRLVKNPAGIIEKEGIKEHFCIGCDRINESVNGYRWYRYATPNDPDDIFDLIQEERRKQEYDYQNLIPN